jgi:hypothetical protein
MEKIVWDAYHTIFLCDISIDVVNISNRDGGCLSRKGYTNLGDKFDEKTNKKL